MVLVGYFACLCAFPLNESFASTAERAERISIIEVYQNRKQLIRSIISSLCFNERSYLAQPWYASQLLMQRGRSSQHYLWNEKDQHGEKWPKRLQEHTRQQQSKGFAAEQDDAIDAVYSALQLIWNRG